MTPPRGKPSAVRELVPLKWVVQPTLLVTDGRQRKLGEFVPVARVFYERDDLIEYLQGWTPETHAQELQAAEAAA